MPDGRRGGGGGGGGGGRDRRAKVTSKSAAVGTELRAAYLAARLSALEEDNTRGRRDAEREAEEDGSDYEMDLDELSDDLSDDDDDGDRPKKSAKKATGATAAAKAKAKKKTRVGGKGKKRASDALGDGLSATARKRLPAALRPRFDSFEEVLRNASESDRSRYEQASSFTDSPLPGRPLCELTGLPARYTHKATRMRFATKREFHTIEDMPALAVQARMQRML